ncbi:hypothetical protein A6F68_00896 [Tsuneonella dongtanensis]|uniref:Uncharacterized protein n=1 Tax=Tsuneonella dongtanensis TaxID=692370 RepID=A0A1B2ABA7_9SPHN|nr:hypothetical protein A6F68_00896 [Tsuneonella dongtanensis]
MRGSMLGSDVLECRRDHDRLFHAHDWPVLGTDQRAEALTLFAPKVDAGAIAP